MTDDIGVQAVLLGINPDRLRALKSLGAESEQYQLFAGFRTYDLQTLAERGIDADRVVEKLESNWSPQSVMNYTEYRAYGVPEEAAVPLALSVGERVNVIRSLIREGASYDQATIAYELEINSVLYVRAIRAGVDFDTLCSAPYARREYVEGREMGYSHAEMMETVSSPGGSAKRFHAEEYHDLRVAGISHGQIVGVLGDDRLDRGSLRYYIGYVACPEYPLSHHEAMRLAIAHVSPDAYDSARKTRVGYGAYISHEEIVEVISNGLDYYDLERYRKARETSCRISRQEFLQYIQMGGAVFAHSPDFDQINQYVALLDAGYPFDEMRAAKAAGFNLYDFGTLRHDQGLTQDQLLELAELKVAVSEYVVLRQQGATHEDIVASARALAEKS